jgi:hypothetical protein
MGSNVSIWSGCAATREQGAGFAVKIQAARMFFFEKKNQKTLATQRSLYPGTPKPEHPKVFCCFFSKKKSFLPWLGSYT